MKDYGKGRYCKKCNKQLGIYNGSTCCYTCSEETVIKRHVPVTSCTSYSAPFASGNDGAFFDAFKPGTERYNQTAFNIETETKGK